MSEEDVRGGLRDAVADEPPLDFDPEALVATARQQVVRRRSLMAAGAATVVVVLAAVAIPVALGRGSGGTTQVAQPPSTTTTSTSTSSRPAQWPPPSVVPAHYTADELRQRSLEMADHLREAVPTTLPEASDFDYGEFGGEAAGAFADGQMYVNAPVTFTIGGARYSLFVAVWAPGAPDLSPEGVCAASGAYCKQLDSADSGPIIVKTDDLGDQTILTMYHFRPTGDIVQIAAYNYDMSGHSPPKYEPTIPVTLDQLTRLATDPELGL